MDDICNSDVLAEVYYVLTLLEKEDYDKIPKDIINFLEKERNKCFNIKKEKYVNLTNDNLLLGTRAILLNLYRDYLVPEDKKKRIKYIEEQERKIYQEKLRAMYKVNDIFKKENETN